MCRHDGLHKRDSLLHFQFSRLQLVVFASGMLQQYSNENCVRTANFFFFCSLEFICVKDGRVKAFCCVLTASNYTCVTCVDHAIMVVLWFGSGLF